MKNNGNFAASFISIIMELTGKIIKVLPERGGISQRTGTEWKVQEYVLETRDNYSRKMCFNVFGADKIAQFNIKEGEILRVAFDIDSHEYQGRWYNSIRAWRVERVEEAPSVPAQDVTPAIAADKVSDSGTDLKDSEKEDDLPF